MTLQEKILKTENELKEVSAEHRKLSAKLFVLQNTYSHYLSEFREECEKKGLVPKAD